MFLKITMDMNRGFLLPVLFCAVLVPPVYAAGDILPPCAQQYPVDDAARLKCYDQTAVPSSPVAAVSHGPERSYLTKAWNLDNLSNSDSSELDRLQPYRQNYLLVNRSSNPNRQPGSPLADHNVTAPADMDAAEIKFQLSFKADIGSQRNMDFLGIKTFRLWGAYTQQSYWQAFNVSDSSPFRETIYEPELIGTLGTGNASGLKLINLGWVHQSNGRSLPESRSWYRLYVLGGWEWNDMTSIMLRGWRRIQENPSRDDNPDIGDYLGRGDLVIRWEPRDKSQAIAMLLRNNLSRTGNRGYAQIDWATPLRLGSAARMHIQVSSGYGESLIDYNHRQNTIGLGFSFREW